MATYKSEYAKIIIIESPFVFMNAYQCQRTLLQMRTKSSSLLEWFVECSWILCKDSANESKVTKLAWMACRVQLNIMQRFCKWEQNHRACLNGLSSAAEFSTKILQMRTKSSSLLEWFVKCSWILCKDSANENKIIKLAWMVCRVQLNFLQSYSKFFTHAMIFIIAC